MVLLWDKRYWIFRTILFMRALGTLRGDVWKALLENARIKGSKSEERYYIDIYSEIYLILMKVLNLT